MEEVKKRTLVFGPEDPRVVHCWTDTQWEPPVLRNISTHRINILSRMPDIIVFFNVEGQVTGWRDDGCRGAEKPSWMDPNAFLQVVVKRLDLPEETKLGSLQVKELPPLGWTYEGILFPKALSEPEEIMRVWVSPSDLRIIQVLYGLPRSIGEQE